MSRFIDLTGQRFGKLVAIRENGRSSDGRTMWLCHCDCGNEKVILGKSLRNGSTRSCGCKKNLVGMRFGRLVVIKEAEPFIHNNEKQRAYLCQCDCGNKKVIRVQSLLAKNGTKSCGCLIKDVLIKYNSIPKM